MNLTQRVRGILLTIATGVLAGVLIYCTGEDSANSFGPSGLPTPTLPSSATSSTGSTPPTSNPGATENTPQGCNFTVTRSKIEDDGGHFYVPVEGDNLDQIIVYVWIEKVNNGIKYGPFDPNTWFDVNPGYDTFKYQLAVERDIDGDGKADNGCQDDRHHGTFTINQPPPPPPPPTPGCTPEWIPGEPEIVYGEWGACVQGVRSRTVTTTITYYNSCNREDTRQEVRIVTQYEECEGPPVDVCPNIEGNQAVIPEGLVLDDEGNCVEPEEPPVDVCPNIEGNQSEVPEGLIVDQAGNCVEPEPPCVPIWTEGDPTVIGETEWSECDDGVQTRTVTYHVISTNQCNEETTFRDYQEEEEQECEVPPEEHGLCLYEIAGQNKQATCEAAGGTFSTHDGSDHCVFEFPGISQNGFNLAPGLSD